MDDRISTTQVLFFGAILLLSACAPTEQTAQKMNQNAGSCGQEIPENMLTPEPPANDVPKEFAKFSGVWIGKWGDSECAALVVLSITKNGKARVVYIWGVNPKSGRKAGWVPTVATISEYRKLLDQSDYRMVLDNTPERPVRWGDVVYIFLDEGEKSFLHAIINRYDGRSSNAILEKLR